MKVKKFFVQLYHSEGPVYRLVHSKGKWNYETELDVPFGLDRMIMPTPSMIKYNEVFSSVDSYPAEVFPSEERINRFVSYLKRSCRHWKPNYGLGNRDGVGWTVEVQVNDFKFRAEGQAETPGNWEQFCERLLYLTEGKYFG